MSQKKTRNDNKTKKNDNNVEDFLDSVKDKQKQKDSLKILEMMKEITNKEPKMWGGSIVGFDDYHYKYKSGREGDYFRIGFSPRKQNLTLYLMDGMVSKDAYKDDMEKLGKFTTGKSCLYIKKLEDVDIGVLKEIMKKSYAGMNELVKKTDGWS